MIETVEMPFVKIGNRRGITATQMRELPWVAEFYRRFPDSFEPCYEVDAVLFIEPDAALSRPSPEKDSK